MYTCSACGKARSSSDPNGHETCIDQMHIEQNENHKYKEAFAAMCSAAGFSVPQWGREGFDDEVAERVKTLKDNTETTKAFKDLVKSLKEDKLRWWGKLNQDIEQLQGDLAAAENARDAAQNWVDKVRAETDDLRTHQIYLFNLLARIHRDGGQHMDEVGVDTAVVEADNLVSGYNILLDFHKKHIQELRDDKKDLQNKVDNLMQDLELVREALAPEDADEYVVFDASWLKKPQEYRNEAVRCRKIAQLLCKRLQVGAALSGIWRKGKGKDMRVEMFVCPPTLNEANLGPACQAIINGIYKQQEGKEEFRVGNLSVSGSVSDEEEG